MNPNMNAMILLKTFRYQILNLAVPTVLMTNLILSQITNRFLVTPRTVLLKHLCDVLFNNIFTENNLCSLINENK